MSEHNHNHQPDPANHGGLAHGHQDKHPASLGETPSPTPPGGKGSKGGRPAGSKNKGYTPDPTIPADMDWSLITTSAIEPTGVYTMLTCQRCGEQDMIPLNVNLGYIWDRQLLFLRHHQTCKPKPTKV